MTRFGAAALASVVVVGAAVGMVLRAGPSPTSAPVQSANPDVPLAVATYGPYVQRIHVQGRIGAPAGGQVKLAFPASGIVARLDVHVGEAVDVGDSLAELDPSAAANDVAQARSDVLAAAANYGGGRVGRAARAAAEARLAAARARLLALDGGLGGAQSDRAAADATLHAGEAKLEADRRALDRATQLYAGGVLARKDVDAARLQIALDEADARADRAKARSAESAIGQALAQARADVSSGESDLQSAQAQERVSAAQVQSSNARYAVAQLALARTTLRATTRGVVSAILKQRGEETDPTQPAIVITTVSSNEATLSVAGVDAHAVEPGDAVMVTSLRPGQVGSGRVRSIVRSVDPATQTATVVVACALSGAVDGDAVEATIDVSRRFGVLIPTSAIVEDPGSGKLLVFVEHTNPDGSEKFTSREIAVASGDAERTLIQSGLRVGERVATQGAFDLLAAGGGD